VDWQQLAQTPGTKVIMMGTDRIGEIAKLLVSHGMSPKLRGDGPLGNDQSQKSIAEPWNDRKCRRQ
jgi:hypothetical protein